MNSLVPANPENFGRYIDFQVCRSWGRLLYHKMNFSLRAVTTSRPIITKFLWVEARSQFLHQITIKHFDSDKFKLEVSDKLSMQDLSTMDYKDFKDTIIDSLNKHAPLKRKYLRANHSNFITKN